MKIALLGGTFDPPHFGHLRTAVEIKESFGLDEVWFIPSYQPPHKDRRKVTPFFHRKKMLHLATKGVDFFSINDIELHLPKPSFTINTLRELRRLHPQYDFYFIMGSDAFKEIDKWHRGEELLNFSNIIIVEREPSDYNDVIEIAKKVYPNTKIFNNYSNNDKNGDNIVSQYENRLFYTKITHLEISSEKIREYSRKGFNISYLTPHEVISYIEKFKLYTAERLKPGASIDSELLANEIIQIIMDNKGKNIKLLDLRNGCADFADFFVICDANSSKRIMGICDKIDEELSRLNILPKGIEGKEEGNWMLMDYGDVIVHIFKRDIRQLYDLEGLWSKAITTVFPETFDTDDESEEESDY